MGKKEKEYRHITAELEQLMLHNTLHRISSAQEGLMTPWVEMKSDFGSKFDYKLGD